MFLIWQVCSLHQPPRVGQIPVEGDENNTTTDDDDFLYVTPNDYRNDFADETQNGLEAHNNGIGAEAAAMASTSSSSSDTQMKMITLNVKYRHVSSTVQVSIDQSVADLKSTILKTFQLLPSKTTEPDSSSIADNYRLIYCGCPLKEKILLLDLNLENESHLHVIKVDPQDASRLGSNGLQGLTPSDYFIYCPACRSIQASKLRTKCLKCSALNSFLISQDKEPQCREDFLSCPIVSGECSNSPCKSTKAKFIFQCRQKHQFADSVPLKHIRNNARHIVCITCEEVHTPVIVFPCDKQHTMCLSCFKIYSVICLNERRFHHKEQFGYTLPCPARCPDSHIQEAHHFHVLGPDEYERYKNFGAEEFVLNNGGVLCPKPRCGQGLLPDTNGNTVRCCSCEHEFCRLCSYDSHLGACGHQQAMESSEQSTLHSTDVLKRCQWEHQSMSLINEISKPCPKCKVKTEKNGGCNHMHCRCGEEWCWICVKVWNQDCMDDHWLD